ncbi:MAG TPA: hypothetical protein VM841_02745 [Actinomycetota bacterium]|nr:hypothetical protein [Actinomycetota bacterium]
MNDHLEPEEFAEIAATRTVPPSHVAGCEPCADELKSFLALTSRLRAMPDAPEALSERARIYYPRRRALDDLVASMAMDPALRARLARDPAVVLREAGLEPSPELIAALTDGERDDSGAGLRLAASLWF